MSNSRYTRTISGRYPDRRTINILQIVFLGGCMAKLGIVKHLFAYHGSNKHSHNFKIEIVFDGKIENDMVSGIDFHEILPVIENELDKLDKKYLKQVEGFGRATVEHIAIYFIKLLQHQFPVDYVKVWEDEDRYACIFKNDLI